MSHTYNTLADTECSGVFWMRMRETQPYHNAPKYMSCSGDYHLFAKQGDKVYIEVRNAGEVVISFAELKKNKYLIYNYYLSLLLTNDKHRLIKNEEFNNTYRQIYGYTDNRVWSLETAYIDQSDYKAYKIIPSGNVCYYKINPADLKSMEYSTPQELERFVLGYMNGLERVKLFSHRSVIYKNLALEYEVSILDKEIEELKAYFEDKKQVVDMLSTITDKYANANEDILREIIVKYLS
uniref:Uncharacterized protein n=1 Tax=viral metagenome TaxID=1070528 RepID=A0A6C0K9R2_9ZZZZ